MSRLLLPIGLLLVFTGCDPAPANDPDSPAGFVPERLERIDNAIEEAIGEGVIPGAVVHVTRNGGAVYHKAYGHADIAAGTPMTTESIFRIASMTKAITTAAVLQLYEQGHFQLSDPVAEFLPEFADMRVIAATSDAGDITETAPAGKPIRIIHLLTHTAGLAYPFMNGPLKQRYKDAGIIDGLTAEAMTLPEHMALLAKQPLLFEPGESYNYGLNTDVLGYLVEVVSGQPLDVYIAERIAGPLGMQDTHFYLPEGKAGRLVALYAHDPDRGLVAPRELTADIEVDELYPVRGARSYHSGGAGLSSTARDYARFTSMLLNDGELDGVRVLSRKSVELMQAPRVDTDNDGNPEIGLGVWVVTDLGRYGELGSEGAWSWGGAFYTSYWIDPAENLSAVFMSQVYPANTDIATRFRTLVYQALE